MLWHAGGRIHPLHGHSYHFGWERRDRPRYSRVRECDYVTGCGFLLRSEALKKIGCFKEDLVFYSEDAELCYRVREGGYKVGYYPLSLLVHLLLVCPFKMVLFALVFRWKNSVGIFRGIRDWRSGNFGWLPNN